jgi:protein-disulfide isomerase
VNGKPISAREVQEAAADELAKIDLRKAQFEMELQRDRASALETALDTVMKARVLAAEAAKRKISVEELLAIEVDSAEPQPSDDAIVEFYASNKASLQGTFADHVAGIRAYLRQQQQESVLNTFIKKLKRDYGAASYLEPQRIAIVTEGRPSKGRNDAPVTIVEFSDFECPYCAGLFPTLQQIMAEYEDKTRLVYLQFPLADIHPNALKAAEASLCAQDQNTFWQMHDAMFADPSNLKVEDLKKKAAALSLDGKAFDACLDSGTKFSIVRSDVSQGSMAGVTGTPALLINGRLLVGNQPPGEIRRIIDDELQRAAAKQAQGAK